MAAQLRYHYPLIDVDALPDVRFFELWEELAYCRKVEQHWQEEGLRAVLAELIGK